MTIEGALYLESCIFILKPLPKKRLRQLRVRNDSCEIHPAFQVLIALMCELSQQLLLSNRSREKSNRKEYLHQWQMIQASIKACYSDYSSIDVGSHKNSLALNQFNPMNWHGLVNEWMRNHRRTKTPSAQATRSTLVLMHGATNRAGYELYSFIEFVFEFWVCLLGN